MRVQPLDEMQIAVAHAGRGGAHEDLMILRIINIDLLDGERLMGTMENGGLHSNVSLRNAGCEMFLFQKMLLFGARRQTDDAGCKHR